MFEIQRGVCLRKMPFFEAYQLCVAGNQAREGKGKVVEKPQDARVLGVTQVLAKMRFRFESWNHQPGVGIARELGGGNSNIFDVHPDPWGNDPIWRAYFSDGLETTN